MRDNPLNVLKTALELACGPAIFFVVALGDKEEEELRSILGDRLVIEIEVSPREKPCLGGLKEQIDSLRDEGKLPVLLIKARELAVANFEWAEKERVEQARDTLQHLNMNRGTLASLGIPVIFLVGNEALKAFSVWAADLFSVNSGVFDLTSPHPVT